METNYIQNDISTIGSLIKFANSNAASLSAVAQNSLGLRNQLLDSPGYNLAWAQMNTFVAGYADYLGSQLSSGVILYTVGPYWGDKYRYHGNLNNFKILSGASYTSPLSDCKVVVNGSNALSIGLTYNLSAGRWYGLLANQTAVPYVALTPSNSAVSGEDLVFLWNQFAFVNQYIWSDPAKLSQTLELSAIPQTNIFFSKTGVDLNARSVLSAAASMFTDTTFYINKGIYLSPLV